MSNYAEFKLVLNHLLKKQNDFKLINFIVTSNSLNWKYKYFALLRYLYTQNIQFVIISSTQNNIHNIYSTIHSNIEQNQHVLYLQSNELKLILEQLKNRQNKLDIYTFESNVLCSMLPEYLTYNRNIKYSLIFMMVDFKIFNFVPLFDMIQSFKKIKLHPMSFINGRETQDEAIIQFIQQRYTGPNCTYYKFDQNDSIYNMLQIVAADLNMVAKKSSKSQNNILQLIELLLKIKNSFTSIHKNLIYILVTTPSLGLIVTNLQNELSSIIKV